MAAEIILPWRNRNISAGIPVRNIYCRLIDIIKMFLKNMFNSPIKKKKRVLHFNKNYVGAAEVLLRDRQFSNGFKIFFSFYQKQPAANVAFSRLVILLIVENRFIKGFFFKDVL